MLLRSLLALAFACLSLAPLRAQPLAFPGAEGFGRLATGGRGGEVYVVTNLNDSGPGSLRDALNNRTAGVPRTVVFAVSGTIYLNSQLGISGGNLTIAGQTAPGDGICLARYTLNPGNSNNVIIRFIRSRLGDTLLVEDDAFSSRYATNLIVDHCSFSWSVDETASAYINTNFTLQWCFVTESLNNSVHSKGAHGYGGIWGGLGATFHHNLLAHHNSRNPRFSGAGGHGTDGELVDMRNNVVYNWKGNSTYGGEPTSTGLPSHQNVINNYYRYGPATGTGTIRYRILNPSASATVPAGTFPYGLFFVNGNFTTASATVAADNWAGGIQGPTATDQGLLRAASAFTVPAVVTQTAQNAFPLVLAYGGCLRPNRDSVDTRIVGEVTNGTFTYRGSKDGFPGIIDSQTDVGGWPVLNSTPAPTDTDADGMPDAWETARGLNPNLASDRNLVDPVTGYTNLEVYLNELAAPAFPFPVVSTQPQSRSVRPGDPFTLSVTASGPSVAGSLAYQWYRDGAAISGATTASYSVASATAGSSGRYQVLVSNAYGPIPSAIATITIVEQAPAIGTQPVALTVTAGYEAVLSVSASGSPTLAYQWFHDGVAVPGANAATLRIVSTTAADAGNYYVVVSNSFGTATSATVALTVNPAPGGHVFATDFSRDTIHAAAPVVNATRTNWYLMASKTATASSVGDDPGTTSVVETRPLTLALNAVTTSGLYEGATVFSPGAPLDLQKTGASLKATVVFSPRNISSLGFGFYNSGGVLPHTTHAANLSGTATPGVTDTLLGGTADITGGTQGWKGYRGMLSVGNTTVAQVITRQPQVDAPTTNSTQELLTSGSGSSYAKPLGVTIGTATNSPAGYLAFVDDATYTLVYTITRSATDAYDIAFRVFDGANPASDATPLISSTSKTTAALTAPSAVTSAFDSFALGARTTNSAVVSRIVLSSLIIDRTVPATAPTISTQPVGQRVNPGASVTLTVAATGEPAPTFLWKKDGAALVGATSDSLVLSSVQAADAGSYVCEASNSAGTAVSNAAVLIVNRAPAFGLQPSTAIVTKGQPFTLTATASGDPAPTYQWYRGASALVGATGASYAVASAGLADAGAYTVQATNAAGTTTSATAFVVVRTAYEVWLDSHGLDPAGDGAPTEDPIGDGVPNLIRFALGGNPSVAGSTPLPVFFRSGTSLVYRYDLKTVAAVDYTHAAELSSDLATWSAAVHGQNGVSIATEALDADTQRVSVSLPGDTPRVFVRLRVSAKP